MAMNKQRKTSNISNIFSYDDAGNIVIKDYSQVIRYSWNGTIHGFVGQLSVSSVSAAVTDTDKFLVSDGGVLKFRTGAEVLSDIGAFILPSFTSGSVLFSNGTSIAQDNANFFWDDANNRLGIGTNVPATTFQVNGLTTINTSSAGGINTSLINFIHTPGGLNMLLYGRNDALVFGNSISTNNTHIYNGGFLLIGTESKSVNTSARFIVSGGTAQGIHIESSGLNSGGIIWQKNTSLSQQWATFVGTSSAYYISNSNNSTNYFALFPTGNLVLQNGGTFTDAGYRLDVNGTARIQSNFLVTNQLRVDSGRVTLQNNFNGGQGLYFADNSGNLAIGYKFADFGAAQQFALYNSGNLFLLCNLAGTALHNWTNAGNVNLGYGSTDIGNRLSVNGDAFIKGSGATSATNALLVQNNAVTELFKVDNAGQAWVQNRVITPLIQSYTGSGTVFVSGGFGSVSGGDGIALGQFTSVTNTSGIHNRVITYGSFLPTSGTGVFNAFQVAGVINQVGATGITRGLYVNPTLTAAADWRSIEWSNNSGWGLYGAGTANNYLGGRLLIGTTSIGTYALDVVGGFRATSNTLSDFIFTGANSNWTSLTITNTATNGRSWQVGAGATSGTVGNGNFFINDSTSGITRFVINSNGYVGLNKTNSGFPLDMSTATNALGALSSGGSVLVSAHFGNGFYIGKQSTTDAIVFTMFSQQQAFIWAGWDGANIVERMRLTQASNLLLGITTDAGYKLDVNGTARVSNTFSVITTATTNDVALFKSTEPYITIEAAGASNSASIFLKPSTSAQNATIQNRTGGGLEFYTGATPSISATIKSTGAVVVSSTLGLNGVEDSVKSGKYTPTLTNGTNVASSAVNTNTFKYVRVGNVVNVSGWLSLSATSANTLTELEISLPIASNITSDEDVSGVANTLSGGYGQIRENATNNTAKMYIQPTSTSNLVWYMEFSYVII